MLNILKNGYRIVTLKIDTIKLRYATKGHLEVNDSHYQAYK